MKKMLRAVSLCIMVCNSSVASEKKVTTEKQQSKDPLLQAVKNRETSIFKSLLSSTKAVDVEKLRKQLQSQMTIAQEAAEKLSTQGFSLLAANHLVTLQLTGNKTQAMCATDELMDDLRGKEMMRALEQADDEEMLRALAVWQVKKDESMNSKVNDNNK